ncbi:MobA/MobL family protein [Sulfitobacter marinus]|uniref:MobA/MobL family protein n=2 Tax=Sulfitobacter marinus TaxID=394264 RepID=A0A1I6PM75_9RHOB|nr:MobA/MobL family protein [Sulfitobacter marinus]
MRWVPINPKPKKAKGAVTQLRWSCRAPAAGFFSGADFGCGHQVLFMIHKASRLEIKIRNRSNCTSIVAAAAYCAGERYRCDRTGRLKNYQCRRDVVSVESIKMPHDPERIWNAADAVEKHPGARLAREFVISLPVDLPLDVQRKLVRGYCLWMHETHGVSSFASIHHPLSDGADKEILSDLRPQTEGRKKPIKVRKDERGNPLNQHVHILCPTRHWCDETGQFTKKLRDLDHIVKGPKFVQSVRDEWERRVNRLLIKHGINEKVDLRSYKKMAAAGDAPEGLMAQKKMGPKNAARGRQRELEVGEDSTYLGVDRAETQKHNANCWDSWLTLRALEREKGRLERAREHANQTEAARRMEASEAEAKIAATKTETARVAAIEAAPHLDALDPYAAAMAWAKGGRDETIDPASDRRMNPETETAATSGSGIPPNVEINKNAASRFARQRQRQRTRGA